MHDVEPDKPNGLRTAVSQSLRHAQQQKGDQGDCDLDADGVAEVPRKRVIFSVCLIQRKSSVPAALVEIRDLLGGGIDRSESATPCRFRFAPAPRARQPGAGCGGWRPAARAACWMQSDKIGPATGSVRVTITFVLHFSWVTMRHSAATSRSHGNQGRTHRWHGSRSAWRR